MTTIMEVLNQHNDWAFSLEHGAVLCIGCDWSQEVRDIDPAAVVFRNHQAETIAAAGYVKADHTEYALDHKRSDLQFVDDEGELWTDEEDVKDYASEYGDTAPLVQRQVTAWAPIETAVAA